MYNKNKQESFNFYFIIKKIKLLIFRNISQVK